MRAICLHQPYASLMQVGAKKNETRNRLTHVRGEVAICATKKLDLSGLTMEGTCRARMALDEFIGVPLPHGCVLCVVELYDCLPVEVALLRGLAGAGDKEIYFGDYSNGRYAWLSCNLQRLKTPVPVTGHQGFFNLPPAVESGVMSQL
jgi:activating signal cointegrator 1